MSALVIKICALVIFSLILDMVLPEGKLRANTQFALSLLVVLAIVSHISAWL